MINFYAFGLWDAIVNAISSAFSWVFNKVFRPIFEAVFTAVVKPVVTAIIELIYQMLKDVFLMIFQYLCQLLDIIEQAFDIFAGTSEITVNNEKNYLINVVIGQSSVSRAFWSVTLIAFILCMIFAVTGVLRSAMDMEGKQPVGKVLGSAGKAMLSFLIVPFVIIASINLSSVVLKGSSQAMEMDMGYSNSTIGKQVFVAVVSNYLKSSYTAESIRKAVYNDELDYRKVEDVHKFVDQKTVKYENGIIAALVITIMMVIACFMFVRRIMEIAILYIVSPFFVSTMPLDDGARFKQWREMFIAKVVSGFGTVYSMKIYLLLLPLMTGTSITYFDDTIANSIMQLIFMCGGSYAVIKSQGLIMQMVNPQVAAQDDQAMAGIKKAAMKPVHSAKKRIDRKKADKRQDKRMAKNAKKASQPKKTIRQKAQSVKAGAHSAANAIARAPRQISKIPQSIGQAAGSVKFGARKALKPAKAFGSKVGDFKKMKMSGRDGKKFGKELAAKYTGGGAASKLKGGGTSKLKGGGAAKPKAGGAAKPKAGGTAKPKVGGQNARQPVKKPTMSGSSRYKRR